MTDRAVTTAYRGAQVAHAVNRRDILEQIETAVRDRSGHTYVFYIEADGGMGKTFLAREVLRRCQEGGEWAAPDLLAARHEVDLYHHQARSQEGFMAAFVKALVAGNRFFTAYQQQSQRLQEVKDDLRGAINELKAEQILLPQKFLEGCEELGREKRVVVVLDTLEKLQYRTDRIEQALGLGEETFDLRNWLLEDKGWLSHMHNAVILICGRRNAQFAADLEAAAKACPNTQFKAPKLRDFTEAETLEYIAAVEETARQDRNHQALKRLQALPLDSRRAIHFLTEGRPITLALIVDYYLATERLLPAVKIPLADLQALPDEKKRAIRDQVKDDVMRLFKEIGRPADDALLALAWAPMGMDAELLSLVADLELPDARRILEALADRRTGLSFVKIRPNDRRVFLHDEMYALVEEYVLKMEQSRVQDVYDVILKYYADRIEAQQKTAQELHSRLRGEAMRDSREGLIPVGEVRMDPQALADALAELDALRIEEVYYRLRRDPLDGFAQYCEYAEAAVTSYNSSLDMQLRDEMLRFVQEVPEEVYEKRGLQRDAVERDSALRWGWRSVYAAQPEKAHMLVQYLRKKERDFIARGGALARAELDIIHGWASAFLGTELQKREKELRRAVKTLRQFAPETDLAQLRRNVLLAQAHNVLGYCLRVQGRYQVASTEYRRALPLWRDLKREADHAEALNNLAFAYAEVCNFRRAVRSCHNGLDLREKLGQRYLIALSYNTLGLIEIKNDQPHRGMVHCGQALAIFRNLGTSRGIGLAYTALAEAHRRSTDAGLYPPPEKIRQLLEAETYATKAVRIFRDEVPERLRLVEALNELGCIYRNLSRWCDGQDSRRPKWIEEGVKALTDAADQARDELAYCQIDALVNLAWLYFYIHQPDRAQEILDQVVQQRALSEYQIIRGKGVPRIQDPSTFLWVQLSKIHVLRGEIAMRRYWLTDREEKGHVREQGLLDKATEHFTLALAYGELFSDDYRDIRRAKDAIYAELCRANVEEMRAIYQAVETTACDYNLRRCPARRGKPARPRMRNFLEENFGTLEELEEERT